MELADSSEFPSRSEVPVTVNLAILSVLTVAMPLEYLPKHKMTDVEVEIVFLNLA